MQWIDATLVSRQFWTDTLFSIEVEAPLPEYQAGQFAQLGLMIDGELIKRAYSFVNAPNQHRHEFYLVSVADGLLSPRLATLPIGATLQIADHASGFFTLSEVPDAEHLVMLSTGTAVGPFISMLRTALPWQRFSRITLVQGVRYNQDVNYVKELEHFANVHPCFQFIPMITREAPQKGLAGRITDAIESGLLAEQGGFELTAQRCQVMICGNPQMVKESRDLLKERGFERNLRRKPGHLTVENYW